MALNLVAYDASDDESDHEEESVPSQVQVVQKVPVKASNSVIEDVGDVPKPSEKELQLAELARKEKENLNKNRQLSQLAQKKNGRVVIGIPSLSEFDDDEEDDESKKPKKAAFVPSKGHSKLFSKLPQPKNSSYEPPTEPIKPPEPKKSVPLIPQSVAKKISTKRDSDDEDNSGSFFSLDEPEIKPTEPEPFLPPVPTPVIMQAEGFQHVTEISSYVGPTNQQYNLANMDASYSQEPVDVELDQTALEALQGTKRKLPDDAQIIEIREERLTYDPSNSYLKSISEERSAHNSEDFQYNKVQKKKHQITYLAAQAKAREVDLKNQWAQNKMSRRQTQQKYGF